MRIISDFKDYYDTIMSMGMDLETVYLRRAKHYYERKEAREKAPCWLLSSYDAELYTAVIGFCNKLYPAVKTDKGWVFDQNEAQEWINKTWASNKYLTPYTRTHPPLLDKFFEQKGKIVDIGCPVFTYSIRKYSRYRDEYTFVENGRLRDFDFQSVKDPYTAFQELYQFLANQARPEPEMIETSDETRLEAHGFDKKFSFRKEKQK